MEFSLKTINAIIGLILVTLLVQYVTHLKFGEIEKEIPSPTQSYVNIKNVDKTLDCMAMNIYREAGNESFEGKVAVAQVVLNRLESPHFPKDICKVVYQKNIIMEKVVCQFSWYCDSAHRNRRVDTELYSECYAVAKKVLLEGFRLDMIKDALYYHANYVDPGWKHERVGRIGHHIFYRRKHNA
jgi:spore germination cell wall hydrolase CwlJ-like protein